MNIILFAICLAIASTATPAEPAKGTPESRAIGDVLDAWHAAAAAADEEKYFAYFAPDAVFLGTDATERWTRDAFRAYAHPHFAKGKAWSFKPVERVITLSPDRNVGWFDEALATPNLGPCRGSGVLIKTKAGWKITQYNLSIPIPNDLVDEFKKRIDEDASRKPAKK